MRFGSFAPSCKKSAWWSQSAFFLCRKSSSMRLILRTGLKALTQRRSWKKDRQSSSTPWSFAWEAFCWLLSPTLRPASSCPQRKTWISFLRSRALSESMTPRSNSRCASWTIATRFWPCSLTSHRESWSKTRIWITMSSKSSSSLNLGPYASCPTSISSSLWIWLETSQEKRGIGSQWTF